MVVPGRRLIITGVIVFFYGGALHAWEEDVHYVLTFWLATQAGFSRLNADEIAKGNQSHDDSSLGSAIPLVTHAVMFASEYAARQVQVHHFPSDASLPSPPLRRVVLPASDSASELLKAAVVATQLGTALKTLGEALHPFQDSWSHQGVPDPPLGLRANLAFGHPRTRGGWWTHDADQTFRHPHEVVHLARETYRAFQTFLELNPTLQVGRAIPWSKIAPIVHAFAKAEDKGPWVSRYLRDSAEQSPRQNIPGFAAPGSREVVVFTPIDAVRVEMVGVSNRGKQAAPELVDTAQSFLNEWLTRQRVRLAIEFVDWTVLERQFANVPAIRGRFDVMEWCATFMAMQLAANHRAVERLGHGDPSHPRYRALPRDVQREGLFRSVTPMKADLLPAQFIPIGDNNNADPNDDDDFMLILRFGGSLHDDVALVWRQTGGWRIVQMLAMPS
jgi:hypothetical protein